MTFTVSPPQATLLLPPGAAPGEAASRTSRVSRGTFLVAADLHNHTAISDGAGDPAAAYASLRAAGLDVAALTDHVHFPDDVRARLDAGAFPDVRGRYLGRPRGGLTDAGWERTRALADAADQPGLFTAIPGFEWTEPWLGHVNIWFSTEFTPVRDVGRTEALYAWLHEHGEALAGFNHPGREPGRFGDFVFAPAARRQLVGLEMFNRYDDYLFEGYAEGQPSPLVACLSAGWRPGLLGVTDEHEDTWGFHVGKGRTGMWVGELSRAGVAEALRARRTFATRHAGLRVDAVADGVRMGGVLRHRAGPVTVTVDVDRGPDWVGRALEVQVLRPGNGVPTVVEVVPLPVGEVLRLTVDVALDDGDWLLLRVADPAEANGTPGPAGHPANNAAVAYTSPWYLEP